VKACDCDLIIAGAGPAGASAARRAAELGLSVLVLESEVFPRFKPCGGGLTPWALRWLSSLEELDGITHERADRVDVWLGPDVNLTWAGAGPIITTTLREELDSAMARRAMDAGAHVLFGARVESVAADADGVTVRARGEDHRGRFLVAADGARGAVRGLVGSARPPLASAVYLRAFPPDRGALSPWHGRVLIDITEHRAGYGWVFPKKDHLNVGVYAGTFRQRRLRSVLDRLLRRLDVVSWRSEGPFASVVPVCAGERYLGDGRILFAGDAAGLGAPITGEGISHALASGEIVAGIVHDALRLGHEAGAAYRDRIVQEVLPRVNVFRRPGNLVHALGPRVASLAVRSPFLRRLAVRGEKWDEFTAMGGRLVVESAARNRRQ